MVLDLKTKGYNINKASIPVWLKVNIQNQQLATFVINGQLLNKTTKKMSIALQLPNVNAVSVGDSGQVEMFDQFNGNNAEEQRAFNSFGVNAKRYIYSFKITNVEIINFNGFNVKLTANIVGLEEGFWRF